MAEKKYRYDTYCGLYCGACSVLMANKTGKVEQRAKEWDMDSEGLRCRGCKTKRVSSFCAECEIKKCAERKKVAFCFECTEYPCTHLIEFLNDKWSHHSIILISLERIHKVGREKWIEEQKKRWCCPECGTAFTWYDTMCQNCGNTLYSCKEEEKDLIG